MICGTYGQHHKHLRYQDIIGLKAGANNFAPMNMLLHSKDGIYLRHLRECGPPPSSWLRSLSSRLRVSASA
jgi:hypothetical protein